MEYSQTQLLLKRAINVKVVVTPRWKEEAQEQSDQQRKGICCRERTTKERYVYH